MREQPMDFSLSDDLADLKDRTERFVREQIVPYENAASSLGSAAARVC
jgi:hypothetical protein